MSLFWAEHQKLWRAGLTRLATGLFLALLTALQLWSYQSANYGTMKADGSRYLDGPANIRERQAYARQWEVLTDETLQQMVSALQTARAADPEMDSERVNLYVLNDLLGRYWPELTDETQPYPSMLCWYANPASLTGLYDRRDAALRTFLENQFADPADQALFYRQDAQVERPLRYGWTEGWANLLGNGIGGFGQLFLPPVLGLVLSPVFAGEKRRGMRPVQLTTRRGAGALARAKVGSALAYTMELYGLYAGVLLLFQFGYLGIEGWDLPIQLIKSLATAPWAMWQGLVYEFAYVLCSSLGFAGITLLFSALLGGTVPALAAALLTTWLPQALAGYLPWAVRQYLNLLPFVGGAEDSLPLVRAAYLVALAAAGRTRAARRALPAGRRPALAAHRPAVIRNIRITQGGPGQALPVSFLIILIPTAAQTDQSAMSSLTQAAIFSSLQAGKKYSAKCSPAKAPLTRSRSRSRRMSQRSR